jgi:hypothetical protein
METSTGREPKSFYGRMSLSCIWGSMLPKDSHEEKVWRHICRLEYYTIVLLNRGRNASSEKRLSRCRISAYRGYQHALCIASHGAVPNPGGQWDLDNCKWHLDHDTAANIWSLADVQGKRLRWRRCRSLSAIVHTVPVRWNIVTSANIGPDGAVSNLIGPQIRFHTKVSWGYKEHRRCVLRSRRWHALGYLVWSWGRLHASVKRKSPSAGLPWMLETTSYKAAS